MALYKEVFRATKDQQQAALEALLKATSLTQVREMLVQACQKKAARFHSEVFNQSEAQAWQRDAQKLEELSLEN